MANSPGRTAGPGLMSAVFGRRPHWFDAEHDDAIVKHRLAGRAADFSKDRGIGHDMIGGEHDHDRIAAAPLRVAGAGDDCRSQSRRIGSEYHRPRRRSPPAVRRLETDIGHW